MTPLIPASIAVIGASTDKEKIGALILQNLITQGYKGTIYPVNPKHAKVQGKKAYKSIGAIKETVDMAVIVTPAKTVPALATECGKKGVNTVVVISAGFGETGKEGKAHEDELTAIADEYGFDLIGPNCLGVINPHKKMNASFAKDMPPKGSIALISQSGAFAVGLMDQAHALHLGFSHMISIGNKAQRDECDALEWAAADPKTKVIGMYIESINDGWRFRELATEIAREKPIVLIKAGTSERGKNAVSSHTGSLAGSDAAIDALCLQTGIRRAKTFEEFTDVLRVLSMQPTLLSNNIAVITNAGGPGILATDAAEREALHLTNLQPKTVKDLKEALPSAASSVNPVDVLGDAAADRYAIALHACAQDKKVDGIVVIATPQVMTPLDAIAKEIVAIQKTAPLMPIVTAFIGDDSTKSAEKYLATNSIPNFDTPERAMRAMATLQMQHPEALIVDTHDESLDDRSSSAREILKDQRGALDELSVQDLLDLYDLDVPNQGIAKSADEAVRHAKRIGYPVIMKISSPDILHKSDVGGVQTDLHDAKAVRNAFKKITANVAKNKPSAGINGILVQKFLPVGHEFIVGAVRDPSFGPLIMVGLGGIYTEMINDTAFRLAPFGQKDAYAMIEELQSWQLLLGMRGKEALDIDALAMLIHTISELMIDCDQIQEIDINPVLLKEKGFVIADAKIVIAEKQKKYLR